MRYYYTSAISCASFLIFYKYISPYLSIKIFPGYVNLPLSKQIEWATRFNSSMHAILVSILCMYCLLYEHAISQDPIWGESNLVRTTCAIVVGYMLSDVIIVLWHYKRLGDWFFLFHHAASIYAFYFAMTYAGLLWFANVRLIAEFSTPFVNKRWFYDVLKYNKSSPPFILNGFLMTSMFFVVRVVSIPFYWMKVYGIYGSEKSDSLGVLWYVLISSCVILDVINVYWFYRISQGAVKLITHNGRINYSIIVSSMHAYLYYTHEYGEKHFGGGVNGGVGGYFGVKNAYNNNTYNNNTYNTTNNFNNNSNTFNTNNNTNRSTFSIIKLSIASHRAANNYNNNTHNNNNSTLQHNYEELKSR